MKSIKSILVNGSILCCFSMLLTSCEGSLDDIFGEWSRPTKTLSIEETPLTIEAVEQGTIKVIYKENLKLPKPITYTKNGVSTSISSDTDITVAAGDVITFCSENSTLKDGSNSYLNIQADHKSYVYGNVMSLINDEGDFSKDKTISGEFAFDGLFRDNKFIYNHPEKKILLPATNLSKGCYARMFSGCKSLMSAPELPATELTEQCYLAMFYNCTELTKAPELPATKLSSSCYSIMFIYCKSLKTAPSLPATKLAEECYNQMFSYCSNLTTAPELPATTLTRACYFGMFNGCSNLENAPILPAVTLAHDCYVYLFSGCSKISTVTCMATSGKNSDSIGYWLDDAGTDATSPTLHVTAGHGSDNWFLPTTPTWNVIADL